MAIKYYHNALTGEIDSYEVEGSLTSFNRGILLAYGDYLTTGFDTKQQAEEWAKHQMICRECKASRSKVRNKCFVCGNKLESCGTAKQS